MSNNEAVITIRKRHYSMSVDGLTEMEIGGIADQVEKKMDEIEKKTNIPDTSKLAVMAAMEFATELYNLKQNSDNTREADSRKIDELVGRLEKTLDKELF